MLYVVPHTQSFTLFSLQATVKPGILIFLTTTTHPTWSLPSSISPLFRTFSLPPLDPTILYQATCTILGLRSPRQLASKLVTLHRLANQQL